MKCIVATLMLCLFSSSTGLANQKSEDHSFLKGRDLERFLKNYVEVEIDEIQKGHSISLRVPNIDSSDRKFHSIQLFLIKPINSDESEVDVFEVTSGRSSGDINFLMNISSEKAKASYVVFREERRNNRNKKPEWVETTVQLADLLAAQYHKDEQPAAGSPVTGAKSK